MVLSLNFQLCEVLPRLGTFFIRRQNQSFITSAPNHRCQSGDGATEIGQQERKSTINRDTIIY